MDCSPPDSCGKIVGVCKSPKAFVYKNRAQFRRILIIIFPIKIDFGLQRMLHDRVRRPLREKYGAACCGTDHRTTDVVMEEKQRCCGREKCVYPTWERAPNREHKWQRYSTVGFWGNYPAKQIHMVCQMFGTVPMGPLGEAHDTPAEGFLELVKTSGFQAFLRGKRLLRHTCSRSVGSPNRGRRPQPSIDWLQLKNHWWIVRDKTKCMQNRLKPLVPSHFFCILCAVLNRKHTQQANNKVCKLDRIEHIYIHTYT